MGRFVYRGRKTAEISFPLGGIGTGSIGLGGNGRLCDWEIRNRPDKGSMNGFSHFAVRAEEDGRVLDARALVGDVPPPYTGRGGGRYGGFGFGPARQLLQGLPHFSRHEFVGEFPCAEVRFRDPHFPGRVSLRAFNPFIPLNAEDSSLPAAFFTVAIRNTTDRRLSYTAALSVRNPFDRRTLHEAVEEGRLRMIRLSSLAHAPDDPAHGTLTVAAAADRWSRQTYWYRGSWFDNLGVYWRDLCAAGPFADRTYPPPAPDDDAGRDDHALLAVHVDVEPGGKAEIPFVVAWHFPVCVNYWNPGGEDGGRPWKNHYATVFPDSTAVARYCMGNRKRLLRETERFRKALFSSTLPRPVLDAVSANLSVLKSPTVLRLEDGSFYGFEGCHCDAGCCEGSCTHVWNYAYALCFLFPALERSMREIDYTFNMRADGKMGFRLQLPPGRPMLDWHACADGQFGGVIKTFREWKISGDTDWLRRLWPAVRAALEFAWAPTNEDRWDADRDGVLEGRQHHTLDTELFGPNSYLTGFYLAALKAAAEMADALGETAAGREYRELFARGAAWVDANLFNGEYYVQRVDVKDRAVLEPYRAHDAKFGDIAAAYWSGEHGELKHQIGGGCHCDQVVAQWHADLCGLGDIFDPAKVRAALAAIHRHNFVRTMRETANPCRVFALNDEAALMICAWPRGGKPAVPLTYAEEAMNGFEYQAAAHMIMRGMVDEGLEVVAAVRDRYDGERRNPWNEFECGSNYARSMASFSLLPALSGFRFDMVRGHISFAPVRPGPVFSCFWSLDGAWGTYRRGPDGIVLAVAAGRLTLRSFGDPSLGGPRTPTANRGPFRREGSVLVFAEPVAIGAGEELRIAAA